jgi:hypothetical protein
MNELGRRSTETMSGHQMYSQLSSPRQTLVRLCQRLNYGLIQRLGVHDADPVFDPHNIVVLVDEKLDTSDAPRPEAELTDFKLAAELCRLMRRLDAIRDGMIERLEVRGGIPRRVVFVSGLSELFPLEKMDRPR